MYAKALFFLAPVVASAALIGPGARRMEATRTKPLVALAAFQDEDAYDSSCIPCHQKISPGIVADWKLSKHSQNGVECNTCHGDDHQSAKDVAKVKVPTIETCAMCHEERAAQFKKGKHALAWAAMKAMPTFHFQPMAMTEGMKGCGGCHKIGLKTEQEIKSLNAQGQVFGNASCDACHTRHSFSKKEAQQPQACQTCHMGFDHPQYEMYSASKHGVRALLKQNGTLPATASAPTCQTCHMPNGTHTNITAWGFTALRLPMPEDKQWAEDRATILKAVGALDPGGKPTPRLDVFTKARVVRTTQKEWQDLRTQMLKTCNQCHGMNFAKSELGKGDKMIREADHIMADCIKVVAKLYADGIIPKPKNAAHAYPDVLTFHDTGTEIEQKLFRMFMEYRMRAFQGTFHANPDYALWYGWSELKQTQTAIHDLARDMRLKAALQKKVFPPAPAKK